MICDICHGRAELMCTDCGSINSKGIYMEDGWIDPRVDGYFPDDGEMVDFSYGYGAPITNVNWVGSEYKSLDVTAWRPTRAGKETLKTQVGGNHYAKLKIQPIEYVQANGLGFHEGNILKYITRWRDKDGVKDLEKARHYLDMLIEFEKGRS